MCNQQDGDAGIAEVVADNFDRECWKKNYVLMHAVVTRTHSWRFEQHTSRMGVYDRSASDGWEMTAEVQGKNQFGASRYRQIAEKGATTSQLLARAVAALDSPW